MKQQQQQNYRGNNQNENKNQRQERPKGEGDSHKKPSHTLFYVRDRGENFEAAWDRIGVAWTNRDESLSCKLDYIPADFRFQIRVNEEEAAD